MGSGGGHSWGYRSECVHYPRRKQAQGEHSGPCQFIAGKRFPSANKPRTRSRVGSQKLLLLRTLWSAFVGQYLRKCLSAHSSRGPERV